MLARERRVLRLLEAHCHFLAPRVLYEDASGWDLRRAVRGAVGQPGMYERIRGDSIFAYRFGQEIGRMLAEQHTRISLAQLDGWLPPP